MKQQRKPSQILRVLLLALMIGAPVKKGSVPTEQIVDWSVAREAVAELDRVERN